MDLELGLRIFTIWLSTLFMVWFYMNLRGSVRVATGIKWLDANVLLMVGSTVGSATMLAAAITTPSNPMVQTVSMYAGVVPLSVMLYSYLTTIYNDIRTLRHASRVAEQIGGAMILVNEEYVLLSVFKEVGLYALCALYWMQAFPHPELSHDLAIAAGFPFVMLGLRRVPVFIMAPFSWAATRVLFLHGMPIAGVLFVAGGCAPEQHFWILLGLTPRVIYDLLAVIIACYYLTLKERQNDARVALMIAIAATHVLLSGTLFLTIWLCG